MSVSRRRSRGWRVDKRSWISFSGSADLTLANSPGMLSGSLVLASAGGAAGSSLFGIARLARGRAFDGQGVVFQFDTRQVVVFAAEGPDDAGSAPIPGQREHGVLAVSG